MNKIKLHGGKNIRSAAAKISKEKVYSFDEAINLIKQVSYVKFDASVEFVLKLGIDVKRSDQVVRGIVSMPSGTGKSVRVAVMCKDERFDEAKAAGADLVGNTELIDSIKAGNINFDVCIATPDMMGAMGQLARILGPKGLMPNPKLGTVTTNIGEAIRNSKAGQVEFRADKGGIIHAGVGKISFANESLLENVRALLDSVVKAKPLASKGVYVQGAWLGSTMSPSLKLSPDFYLR
jgi:large subunit ribosomal protein L1